MSYNKHMQVKVRIAPSPTGNLHIGTARTALFNWLFARRHGGEFILRIEDTDLERSNPHYEKSVLDGLRWLGLQWDGEIYRQSQRLLLYHRRLEQLFEEGKAFWCHHTKKELETEQKDQMAQKESPRHVCGDRGSDRGRKEGELIRLAVDDTSSRTVTFNDAIRGPIAWKETLLGDISLAKDFNTPLYNFAVVADDTDMDISHVIRGEDHISNTPKQILIYEALGAPVPIFAHLPLILGPDRTKLSKRHGATDINEYGKDYVPQALVNFMGQLGYTHSRELLSKEEMAREFQLEKVHKSGAIFTIEKLDWFNMQYLRRLPPADFREITKIKDITNDMVPLIAERLERLSQVETFSYFWKTPDFEISLLQWKNKPLNEIRSALESVQALMQTMDAPNQADIRAALDRLGERVGDRGLIYWPFRVALTGKEKSPDPVDIAVVLGREEVIKRIQNAIAKIPA